ncbi:MAG TPA: neutral zinc metallopeptidase, partial [Bacteroidales bacterium]|nr:neutral zinc metallopeptidase [Bacteroidales bacterium]
NIELTEHQKEMGEFVSVVLGYTEDVWGEIFRQNGLEYRQPKLVLFSDNIESQCGYAAAATGPFYCPTDEKVYIDLDFLEKLQSQLGAQGDFAAAYIIAHEVGHHVQNLLGTLDKANEAKSGVSEAEANKISVKVELQADFLAGIWAHYAQQMKNILEAGDIQEAMNAAEAVGDDRLQKQSQGYVVPDSFTHGTSKQRETWFMTGFNTGDISKGEI